VNAIETLNEKKYGVFWFRDAHAESSNLSLSYQYRYEIKSYVLGEKVSVI
jgi:hypothetical protein